MTPLSASLLNSKYEIWTTRFYFSTYYLQSFAVDGRKTGGGGDKVSFVDDDGTTRPRRRRPNTHHSLPWRHFRVRGNELEEEEDEEEEE